MGANVELDIFLTKGDFSLRQLFSMLEMEELHVSVREMIAFDDWLYTHEKSISLEDIDSETNNLFLHKFTRTHFIVNNKWNCILLTSFEDTYMDVSFALDSDDLMLLDENNSSPCVVWLYQRVADFLNKKMDDEKFKERFIIASMGVEYSVDFNGDIMAALNDNDNGAVRWIVAKDLGKNVFLKNFAKEEKSNIIFFTRLHW